MEFNLFGAEDVRAMQRGGQQAWDDTGANIKGMRDQFTNARAGRAYASGDRQGAARMLAQGGNLDGARVLQGDLRTEQRQAFEDAQEAEALRYTRDRQARSDETAQNKAKAEQRVTVLENVSGKLKGLPKGTGERKAKLMEALPLFKWSGYPQEVIDQLAQIPDENLTDDAISMTTGKVRSEFEKTFNVPNIGVVGVRPDGSSKVIRRAPLIYGNNQNVDIPLDDEGGDEGEDGLAGGFTNDTLGAPPAQVEPQSVMSGFSGQNTISGGSGQDAIPGYRRLRSARAPQGRAPKDQWDDLPGGGQINRATGKKENVPVSGSQSEFAALRKEFNGLDEVDKFKDTASSYNQVRTLSSNPKPTPTDDIALTFSFMKMLDPGSVVREGEFALIGQAAGLGDRALIEYSKVAVGKGLTPAIRARLVETAAKILLTRRAAYDAQARNYRTIATDIGAKPDLLAEDPTLWRGRIKGGAGAGSGSKTQTFNTSAGVVTVRAK